MRYLFLWRNDCCTQTDVYVLRCSFRRSLYVNVFPLMLTSFHSPSIQAGKIQLLFLTTDGHGFPSFGDNKKVSNPFLEECKPCLHVLSRERDIDIVSPLSFLDISCNFRIREIIQIFLILHDRILCLCKKCSLEISTYSTSIASSTIQWVRFF